MLWKRPKNRENEGLGGPVDLQSLAGLPGRLLFAAGLTGSRMTDVPCLVKRVDRADIHVEVADGNPVPHQEGAVILEVSNQTALIQCFTTVRQLGKEGQAILRRPARPHVLQRRRFPRVDIYLGITVRTPERPIDELPAQMTNLSLDGAACVLVEPISPGTLITLNLTALGLFPAEVTGKVVRCTPTPSHLWVIGVKFERLQEEQELYLGKYISDFIEQLSAT